MGNCQAIDSASLVIQHSSGRVEKLYWSVPATNIMKMNPGHYVALLLTTTNFYCHATTNTTTQPLRVTRIKLLRPTDNLVLGHTYKLISAQEVMKGLCAKKYAKIQHKQPESYGREAQKPSSDFELDRKTQQVIKHDRHGARTGASTNLATAKPRGWHPSLKSISEAGT